MTGRNRRNFSPGFRLEAAQLLLDGVSLEIGNFCTLSALFNQSWFVRG